MPVNQPNFRSRLSTGITRITTPLHRIVKRFPLVSFLVLLLALVSVIAVGNQLRQPKPDSTEAEPVVKEVAVYTFASSPQIEVQAQVEKSGVIKLVAQSAGVVQKINVTEGDRVKRGTQLFALSTNYQGGNILSVSRQISYKSYKNTVETYPLQKESIAQSREIALKTETQQADLRAIARQSIDDTKNLISLNEQVVNGLDAQIRELENSNVGGVNDATLTQLRSAKAQVIGGLNGLRSGLRNTEYLNNEEEEPAQIGRLVRDNTLKQLEIQEKALDLGKDLALLNLRIAQINESLMFPASPCPGTVERVFVTIGQSVTPGTLLATIKGDVNTASAVALVSADVANSTSAYLTSTTTINGQPVILQTRYVSSEPTDGNFHSITFSVPDEMASSLSNGQFIPVQLPVGSGINATGSLYIPLDAVYQSQAGASVFVAEQDGDRLRAKSRPVMLGQVFGRFVEVQSGITPGDQIIVNRNLIQDDVVTVK